MADLEMIRTLQASGQLPNPTGIDVTPVAPGIYRLFTMHEKHSIAITAQGLLNLGDWIAQHKERLRQEAKGEE